MGIVCITGIAEISLQPGAHPARWEIVMAQVALPWAASIPAAVSRPLGSFRVLVPLLLAVGCDSWRHGLPIPPEVTETRLAARVLIPPGRNVNLPEAVVNPGTPGQAARLP